MVCVYAHCIKHLFTRHTVVGKGGSCFSLSSYKYHGDGGTDRREILHDGTLYRSRTDLLPLGKGGNPMGTPRSENIGLNFGHLTANISKTISRSVTCQLELK